MSILSFSLKADDNYEKARKKAADPHMSLNGNPLRNAPSTTEDLIMHKNMDRLWRDADAWSDPRTGEVYRAIRSMTVNNGA